MNASEKRLQMLLDSILDSTGSDAHRRELAGLMENEPELTPQLIEQLRTHSLLQWQCDKSVGDGAGFAARNDEQLLREEDPLCLAPTAPIRSRKYVRWMAAIAASILIFGSTAAWWLNGGWNGSQQAVAEVVGEKGVVWSEKTTALEAGRLIHPGRLAIESGSLTLRFRSGATVLLNGAASMRIDSDMLVRLDRGQATAQVPHWAKGFTIETADVEVIDLGTQFGVVAREDGATDVVIFEGQVDLKPIANQGRVQKRLNQGEAARVNSDGAINRIVEVRGDILGGWTTAKQVGATSNAFKAIRDNVPPTGGAKYYYYQITTGGLEDDAWAYVDRHPHQWNGLTAEGLPDFLRGADYARTFNDYRYMRGFEIVVELAMPATLYVFFDDRVPTPTWLLEKFEDTGVNIGLDEGPWEGIPDHRTAVGSGESIDNIFSVWKRRCATPEAITLGAVGDTDEARAMYGIAATPLAEDRSDETSKRASERAADSARSQSKSATNDGKTNESDGVLIEHRTRDAI